MSTNTMISESLVPQVTATAEHGQKRRLEVAISWRGTMREVMQIDPDKEGLAVFAIGEAPGCRFLVPSDVIGGADRLDLVSIQGGVLQIRTLPTMGVTVYDERKRPVSMPPVRDDLGMSATSTVRPRDTAEIAVGPFTFRVRQIRRMKKVQAPYRFNGRSKAFFGASMFLHLVVLGACYLTPPAASGLSFDPMISDSLFLKTMLGAPEAKQEIRPEQNPEEEDSSIEPGGEAHKGLAGQMGDRTAQRTRNRSAVKGPPDTPDVRLARDVVKEMASTAGVIAYLSAQKAPTSPFGDVAGGYDPENALGALTGDSFGSNFGLGGLAPKGTGRGGGGNGTEGIGVGSIGPTSWSLGRGTGRDLRHLTALRDRNSHRVRVKETGGAIVKGALSKDTIRRVVRRRLNQISFCYEQGLAKRPDLEGRVAVKFVISGTGGVMSAAVVDTTLGDPRVEACITETVERLSFPQPDGGGVVIVTYPFHLKSS